MSKPLNHVLCVDDDPDILEVARISLELVGGLTVSSVNGGAECLAQVAGIMPDLILLDVMMPGLDGPATLSALKADAALCHIPIVFMTARVQQVEVERYLALGALDVIPKPFDPMKLSVDLKAIWARLNG